MFVGMLVKIVKDWCVGRCLLWYLDELGSIYGGVLVCCYVFTEKMCFVTIISALSFMDGLSYVLRISFFCLWQ